MKYAAIVLLHGHNALNMGNCGPSYKVVCVWFAYKFVWDAQIRKTI